MGVILHLDDHLFSKVTLMYMYKYFLNGICLWCCEYWAFTHLDIAQPVYIYIATSSAFIHAFTFQVRVALSCPCARTITTRPWTDGPLLPTILMTNYWQNVENKTMPLNLAFPAQVLFCLLNMLFYNSVCYTGSMHLWSFFHRYWIASVSHT